MQVPNDHHVHLAKVFEMGVQNQVSMESLSSYVASAILLNAYPPSMHCKLTAILEWAKLTGQHSTQLLCLRPFTNRIVSKLLH